MMCQMKVFGIGLFVLFLGVVPIVALHTVVMPQIMGLRDTYAGFEQMTDDVVAGKQVQLNVAR